MKRLFDPSIRAAFTYGLPVYDADYHMERVVFTRATGFTRKC